MPQRTPRRSSKPIITAIEPKNNTTENEARRSSDAGSDEEPAAGTGDSGDSGDGAAEDGYTGRLRVQVFTASGAYPVSNALVTVSRPARGLINAAITNSAGQTDMFVLPAPRAERELPSRRRHPV